jgi:hypothetical protein
MRLRSRLCGPGAGRACGGAEDVDGTVAGVEDEENVDPLQVRQVDVEEVASQ